MRRNRTPVWTSTKRSACGAHGEEPCAELVKEDDGRYRCRVYNERLGERQTILGKSFTCVPIRDVIKKGLPYSACAYSGKAR